MHYPVNRQQSRVWERRVVDHELTGDASQCDIQAGLLSIDEHENEVVTTDKYLARSNISTMALRQPYQYVDNR